MMSPFVARTSKQVWKLVRGRALALAILSLLSVLGSCRPREDTAAVTGFPRSQTLYVGGRQWGEPSSFNPLQHQPDWPIAGMNLIYEHLFHFHPLTGKLEPLLAESLEDRGHELEIVVSPHARWNDGKPVTGYDVKYTFDVAKRYGGIYNSPVWNFLTEIKLPEEGKLEPGAYPRRVVFVLEPKRMNPLMVLDQFTDTRIIPRHIVEPLFEKAGHRLSEFNKLKFDRDPVGSGPYKLLSYSSEKIVLVRDDGYWGNAVHYGGKAPAPKYIVHPIYKSNDHFSVALQQGRLDIASSFIPRIWLKRRKGVRTWFDEEPFFVSAQMPMLWFNAQRAPLNDVRMRRAMAFSVDYKDIRELAVSGYSEPLRPGLILPFGLESKYFSDEDARKYGATYDPARAKELLREGGYRAVYGPDGELLETRDATGKRIPTLYIKSPTGWSDWQSMVRIVVRGMRAAGLDVRERFVDANLYWASVFTADFDMILWTPSPATAPSKPWSRLDVVMTTEDFSPPGQKMYKNIGRFNDPKGKDYIPRIDELIRLIPRLTSEPERIAAYRELNRLHMELQPTMPLVYRPDDFYEFNTRTWQNFPTAANPFLPPLLPGYRIGTRILWHLRSTAN